MKKLIIFIIAGLMVPASAQICRADYKDIPETVPPTLEVWFGGNGFDHSNSKNTAEADTYDPPSVLIDPDGSLPVLNGDEYTVDPTSIPEAAARVPGNKAAEYYSLENSPSGGFLYKSADLPNRLHLEADFYNVDDWYGDFRYSYLDYVQIRIMPRRFYHNLDNLTIYDWTGFAQVGEPSSINIQDAGVDDYGVRIDIDQYKIRFKTPGFPFHLFSNGEYILKEGTKQQQYALGQVFRGDVNRNSISSEVDQEKKEYSLGANAHLGPIEIEGSRTWREFDSNVTPPQDIYGEDTVYQVHHVVPELEATTDTVKIHTSHSGRLFVSGTYSKVDKKNNYSGAEATNEMGYGEMVWLPAGYISFTAKYRHQENKAESPATVLAYSGNVTPGGPATAFGIDKLHSYTVHPGVESTMETASLGMRYSLIPRTSLRIKYASKSKEVEELSAVDWSIPLKSRKDIYEASLTNWAIPKTRLTAKFKHTHNNIKALPYIAGVQFSANNEPERISQGVLGIAVTVSPKVAVFLSGNVVTEDGEENHQVHDDSVLHNADALRQTYLGSLAFTVSEKLSISPTYTFMSFKQERDIIWESQNGTVYVDDLYENEQSAHNISLDMMYAPTERLSINASIGYTTTEVKSEDPYYNPAFAGYGPPYLFTATTDILRFSMVDTEEINLRLDTDYDLGDGWGVGVDLRFTDWKDTSFDNPYDGTYIGGLLKITKKIM